MDFCCFLFCFEQIHCKINVLSKAKNSDGVSNANKNFLKNLTVLHDINISETTMKATVKL